MAIIPGFQIGNQIYTDKSFSMYRGLRVADKQPVILKISHIEDSSSSLIDQYQHEYAVLQSLSGADIICAIDLIEIEDTIALIFKDDGAQFLHDVLEKTSLSMGGKLSIATKLTEALRQIHNASLIHKRINPCNILYNEESGHIKLINFEMATELITDQLYSDGSEINQSSVVYIAPEQTGKMNRPLDYRSDLYSLGATLYKVFTGNPVFKSSDMLEIIHSHIAIMPHSPNKVNSKVPKPLSQIIMKLLAKEADDRYLSAAGLEHDLKICLDQYIRTGRIDPFELQAHDICDRFQLSGKLYGRNEEINVLKAAYERTTKGGTELLLVTGYAGIGKSALIREALQQISTSKKKILIHIGVGRFDRIHRDIPYSAIAQAVRDIMRQILVQSDTVVKKWSKKLKNALGPNGQVIIDIVPELEVIIGNQPIVPKLGPLEAQNRLNLVFQNFFGALCTESSPLIFFLDDIQYADAASLKLIEGILTNDSLKYLLGIGAYRDDEVDAGNQINKTIESLKKKRVRLTPLRMVSLGLESVKTMIADSMSISINQVTDLGAITLQKTDGNPFFIKIFLKTLLDENIISFDIDQSRWRWKISRINRLEITDNVVDLLLKKIHRLDKKTRKLLEWGSCLGIEFDLKDFVLIFEKRDKEAEGLFREAVTEGLLTPKKIIFRREIFGKVQNDNVFQGCYRFAHDRIRQAVYASMDINKKQFSHARIGIYYLKNATTAEKKKQLFAIANHINVGGNQAKKLWRAKELAELNLEAGLKAKATAAFFPAFNYFKNGIGMLDSDCWKDHFELSKTLYEKAAETAYLCGYYSKMDYFTEKVLKNTKSILDSINSYETIINSYIARYQLKTATNTAIDVLNMLDVRLPKTTNRWKLIRGFISAKSTLAWKDVGNLRKMKKMKDPKVLAAMKVLASAGPANYFTNQDLMALMTFKAVQLSIKHGNAPESATSYAAYGLILCSVVGDINTGFQFGKLALEILKEFNLQGLEPRVAHLVNAFINHWKGHVRNTLSPLKKVFKTGLETGDFEYAGYGALFFCFHSFFVGIELHEVDQRLADYSKMINRFSHEFSYTFLQVYRQCIKNLQEHVEDPCKLSGIYYDENKQLGGHIEANDKTSLANIYLVKLFLTYFFCDYRKAIKYADLTEKYLTNMTGSIGTPLFYFYDSLCRIAIYNDSESIEQNKIIKRVSENQKKMKNWAKHAPMNHQHKYDLVEAERYAVIGSNEQAKAHYRKAYVAASKHGYRNEEALILERMAIFYANTGDNQHAASTMLKARAAYENWGAVAKVRVLERDFALFLVDRNYHQDLKEKYRDEKLEKELQLSKKDLDMAAVMKATQAISREIVLEKLLDQLMRIIIENAGAQKGLLILKKDKGLFVKASVEVDSDDVDSNQSLPVEESDALSLDIVRYVERTGEPVVINKATDDNQFYTDLHILEHRPKSILCMPILLKEKITGLLYLENSLASNVFTKERVKILNILLAQAAISLENAQLYANLKKEVSVRKNAEERLLHLATALEQAAEGILITETDGTITYANPACEEIFGYSQDEIRGENTRMLRSGLQGVEFFENIWLSLASGENWSGRMSSKKKDGSVCELEVTISPIRDEKGKTSSYVSVSRDVTHEIQMEKELRQAQKMEAMGTLAGGIAHDFNNILAAIMGYTELATYQSPPESPIHQNLERVITSTRRAKDLVRQILAFSRQTDQEARPIQLKIIIKEALKMLRASLPSTIEMQQNIDNNSGFVEADPTQIHQVVMNLCTNAAQAMESGGTLTVNLDDYEVDLSNHHLYPEVIPGKFLRLVVKDSGEGIEQSIIERIFEPFFTTKEPGKGTGMGLAMVHGIIKRCEGAIRVKSEIGKGTTFQVLFPRYHGALSEEEDVSNKEIVPGKERIMFVDDEKALVTLVEEGLQRIGYQVHLETDSNKALDAFKQSPQNFDLIITDQTMPKLTGMELSREIIRIRPDIPIILYSGLMDEITAEMIESVGIRSFLSKPLMLKQLSEEIRQVLDTPERETID